MFSPLIVRAAWPGQTGQEVIDYLDQLGREVISAVTSSGHSDRMGVP
jgi:hypothetical protein